MYSLRHIEISDKRSQHVRCEVFAQVYPLESMREALGPAEQLKAVAESAEQGELKPQKKRRLRHFDQLSVMSFVLLMTLWSWLSQARVWDQVTHALREQHPTGAQRPAGASALAYQRQQMGSGPLQRLFEKRCRLLCTPETPGAFYQEWRLMAIDGTLQHLQDTEDNVEAFGKTGNQYGKGAYPQIRCVLLLECGSHAIVDAELSGCTEAEMHGAMALVRSVQPGMLVMHDAGLFSGALWEALGNKQAQVLCAVGSQCLLHPEKRLADGSYLVQLAPSRSSVYRASKPMTIRVIEYRVTDPAWESQGRCIVWRQPCLTLNKLRPWRSSNCITNAGRSN